MTETNSTPSFSEFCPDHIPYQREAINLLDSYDYGKGALELLLSGSVGSAKSLLAAHCAVHHCLKWPRARLMLGRKALPDLKETIYQLICEHLEGTQLADGSYLREGKHYWLQTNVAAIKFWNGSKIISRSWSDNNFKKLRSLALSAAIFEELTENGDEHQQAYIETTMRVGRLPHIKENWIISCTNPDGPEHWAYERFIKAPHPRRRVLYSVTTDNPFLPKSYIESLKEDLDPKQAQRMIYGKWVSIAQEVVYHQYETAENYADRPYEVDPNYPIWVAFDFNIGLGKPLSSCLMQFIDDTLHIFGEVVVEGLRTLENCNTMAEAGYLDYPVKYLITGDAAGKHRDTRNNRSDYDIIKSFFAHYQQRGGNLIDFDMKVPLSNPPIKKRHNLVNAYCHNANGKRRLIVYKDAPTVDKGLRLTKLKAKGNYIEDDSKPYQHITTAVGYALHRMVVERDRPRPSMIQL